MNMNQMLLGAAIDNGGTFAADWNDNLDLEFMSANHEFGYYVSMPFGIENLPQTKVMPFVVESFMLHWSSNDPETHRKHFPYFLGLWKNPETSLWSIDRTEWFENMSAAKTRAIQNNQLAIWDIRNKTEITNRFFTD